MFIAVLILFIILLIYLKYPQLFEFKNNYISGRYIRLERERGDEPINFANFIIYDSYDSIIKPYDLSVNPGLAFGNGKYPKVKDISDPEDIVLVETLSGKTGLPYVEYDLGIARKISKIVIINRKKFNDRMKNTILRIIDSDRNQVFEKTILELQEIYSIDLK